MKITHIILLVVTFLVPALAFFKKALSFYAALLSAVMALLAMSVDDKYAYFLLAEFLLITVIDKACKKKMCFADNNLIQKSGTRDAIQVFVNGGIAVISVIIWHITKQQVFLLCYTVSLIEGFGDSVASSIGISSGQQTYDICRFRKITSGLSGGVSIAGTMGCAVSCITMALLAHIMGISTNMGTTCLLALAAFIGCVTDSVLGASVQRKEKCTICGIITEKKTHCGSSTVYHSGCQWINNDVVNLISSFVSALLVFLFLGGQ